MIPRFVRRLSLLPALAVGAAWHPALGTGFRLPDQDAFATARGEAFVATADNPSAVYYNPSGITQLEGQQFRGGIYAIDLEPKYRSPSGRSFDNQDPYHAAAQLFYTFTPEKRPVSFGIGAYAPHGLGVEWPADTGIRTTGSKGSLMTFTVNPVVAWKINEQLSIAAGLTLNYADLDLRQGILWPAQPFDRLRFRGSGWDVGYNAGILWKPCEKISLGGTFRSATEINLKGHTEARNDVELPSPPAPFTVPTFRERRRAEAEFQFPFEFVVGVAYKPTPQWNLEFNAEYTHWDDLNTVNVRQSAPIPPLIGDTLAIPLNWQPSWYYEFGATRYLPNDWHVSGGYIFNENSVPDANYQPLVADLDRHFLSIGTGKKFRRLAVDVAYQFGFGPTREVTGSAPSPAGQSADGKYRYISHAVLITVGYRF